MSKRIEVRDLNVYYSKFLAVEGVNLEIEPRSVTAFIGPSGCGKSTFLRTLNRMHEVIPGGRVEGEVLIDGNNLYDPDVDPVLVRRQVGMVFQRPNPFPTMSIKENVLAGVKLNNRRISKTDADDLVEKSLRGANLWNEVKDRLDRPIHRQSGAQRCSGRTCAPTRGWALVRSRRRRRPVGSLAMPRPGARSRLRSRADVYPGWSFRISSGRVPSAIVWASSSTLTAKWRRVT